MTYSEAKTAFELLFTGKMSDEEGKALLVQLYERGESVEEIQAAVEVMRSHVVPLETDPSIQSRLIDIVGTGGDKSGTFNISSTSALVLASWAANQRCEAIGPGEPSW